ncbi:MAG: universal stress protein [Syntrophomonadaceae bacterium]|nr:universal stress protein [Syntrophomonadaceae bacterium]
MFKKILAPTDGSENAHKALQYARGMLAKKICDQVVVLHVVPKITDAKNRGTELQHRAQQLANLEGEKVIEKARALFENMTGVEFVTRRGLPAEEIVRYAAENGFDAIVMGRQGVSKVVEFFIGSTTNEVVRKSTVPVLTL